MNDENEDYWKFIKETAARVKARPDWAKGAIDRPANIYNVNKKDNKEMKECNCGIMRGIENGHNSSCPRYQISPREASVNKAITDYLKKQNAPKAKRKPLVSTKQKQLISISQKMQFKRDQLKELEDKFNKLAKECEHVHADGSSAIENGYFCNTCKICYQDDMGY